MRSFVAAALLGGCGLHTLPLERDAKLERDAVGYVTFGKTKSGETRVTVDVYRLAVTRHALVVWLQPKQGTAPENIGSITLRMSGDQWTQYGACEARTRHEDFDVFITEDSEDARSPRTPALLWASITPLRPRKR